ncbi:MAG: DPP IV N-terminal domain-containing protein, partial [Bacteroidota bacterium]|nr:DPP IV N-terminal domain-containing protein [Bacteroidota bacterium]
MKILFACTRSVSVNRIFFSIGLFLIALLSSSITAQAQYFGRNKVNYKELDFKVLQTPNFDIYHYLNSTAARNRIAQQTEQWYRMHQVIFKDTFTEKNPILFYNNHADFQQTRAIDGQIGVGTGGVTEALKNRVIMPFMESNAQTDHVLGHELVHAFQYHLIQDTLSLNAVSNIPLWMVEGLAEYMSNGPADANTAIWLRNGVATNKLPTLKDLTNKPNEYFPYRWGQAFWAYTTGVYGDTVIRKLFIETARVGYEKAIKNVFKIDAKAFSEKWKEAIKAAYTPYQKNTSLTPPGKQLIYKKNAGELNIVPSISPDGKRVAFWTEKNLFSIDLFVADAETGQNLERVTSNSFASHIDEYSSFESSVAWSSDNRQVAFVAFAKGRNRLIIADADKGKINKEIDIPGVPAISNPAWSPDGKTIVVTGLVDGQSDLYAYNLTNGTVKQLMNDRYSDLQASYSADGKWIAFATDRTSISERSIQHSFSHNIALLNVETGAITNLDFFNGANNLNPVFGASNTVIYFLSDRDGFRNMYSYNISTNQTLQLTNLFTGITGITMYSPAISASRQTDRIVYSHYADGNYTIYSANSASFNKTIVNDDAVNMQAAILPPTNRIGEDIVRRNLENTPYGLVAESSLVELPYKPKFKLDYIGNTGVGVSTGGGMGTGLAGGVNGIFSDILGHNQLYGAISLNGEIYDLGGQFAYLNQKKRINWGVGVSHIPYLTGGQSLSMDTVVNSKGDSIAAVNSSIDLLRTFQDQVSAFASIPFSQTRRLEGGASFSRYYYRLDRYSDYYDPATGFYIGNDKSRLPTPGGFSLGQAYVAFVGDNSNFGIASPLSGHRFRFEAGQYLGAINLSNITGDYRKYFRMAPVTLATRNLYMGRFGKDAENGTLPPQYLGYSSLVRGYDARTFQQGNNDGNISSLSINDLIGSQVYVGNVELRFPLSGPERLSAIKSKFFFSELNLFTDGGVAWGGYEGLIRDKSGNQLARNSKFIFSSGVSLRVNLFGYVIVEPFFAVPWQNG